jgi:hypothetical protein
VAPVISARSAGPGVLTGTPLPPVQLFQLAGTVQAPDAWLNWQMAASASGAAMANANASNLSSRITGIGFFIKYAPLE